MPNDFDLLAKRLDETDAWLDQFDLDRLRPSERELLESLRRYVRHCRRNRTKWRSAKRARSAIVKIDNATWTLLFRNVSRGRK